MPPFCFGHRDAKVRQAGLPKRDAGRSEDTQSMPSRIAAAAIAAHISMITRRALDDN